jgi:hypothetical protein
MTTDEREPHAGAPFVRGRGRHIIQTARDGGLA